MNQNRPFTYFGVSIRLQDSLGRWPENHIDTLCHDEFVFTIWNLGSVFFEVF